VKILTLTDDEFTRLYEVFEPHYLSMKKRVEQQDDPYESNISNYISHDIITKMRGKFND
jgi:hypothetical protein